MLDLVFLVELSHNYLSFIILPLPLVDAEEHKYYKIVVFNFEQGPITPMLASRGQYQTLEIWLGHAVDPPNTYV